MSAEAKSAGTSAPKKKGRRGALIAALCVVAVVAFIGTPLVLRAFVVEAFKIPAGSMYPTLFIGDHLFVNKRAVTPARGDVVVFKYPLDPATDYIKRVVGLPGDVVEIADGELRINGKAASRKRVGEGCKVDGEASKGDGGEPCIIWEETIDGRTHQIATTASLARDFTAQAVPPGKLFVLGDNRENSSDSRVWGFVPLENVKGTASMIWWSTDGARARKERIGMSIR
ncbi:MAG TPA: signal peptidase I [Polyangia bacterium]|nr:signal peptidase I [Polyangia bacterium]